MKTHALVLAILLFLSLALPVFAQGQVLGIHLLSPGDLPEASKLLDTDNDTTHYVTIPLTYDDLNNPGKWQAFLNDAHSSHIIPLIRLTTRFENGSWVVPNREDVIRYATFLSSLSWQDGSLTIILFNEPNHADEWGGSIDPTSYAQIAAFATDWFHTEPKTYIVLPAGLDLAANNSSATMDAFAFWKVAFASDSDFLDKLDGWTSHSYPNPGFSSNPYGSGITSLRGYQHELSFLATYTKKEFPVYITETGWNNDALSSWEIAWYYHIAYTQVWNDPRIKAVTPFLLQGAPGTFAPFSFLDSKGNPNTAYEVYRHILSTTN